MSVRPLSRGESPPGFDDFVRGEYRALVRLGALLSGDAHHGEDLTQMALVTTLRAWGRLHPDGDPASYTRVVMTHLAARAGRRRWRAEEPTEVLPESCATPSATGEVEGAVDARRLLAQLPAPQRLVLVLRFWADHSEAQTAALLGCSVGTVKSRTHRALARLRATAQDPPPPSPASTTNLDLWMGRAR